MSLGVGTTATTVENEIFWGGNASKQSSLYAANQIIDSSVAIGSPVTGQPASKYPAGLIVGKVTATKKIVPFDSGAVDGSEVVYGVLDRDYDTLDEMNNATDAPCAVVVGNAPVKASALLLDGAAFVGNGQEAAARTGLEAKAFYLDDTHCD